MMVAWNTTQERTQSGRYVSTAQSTDPYSIYWYNRVDAAVGEVYRRLTTEAANEFANSIQGLTWQQMAYKAEQKVVQLDQENLAMMKAGAALARAHQVNLVTTITNRINKAEDKLENSGCMDKWAKALWELTHMTEACAQVYRQFVEPEMVF